MRQLFLILLGLSISFCAFNKDQSDISNRENKKVEEKNKVLRDTYDMVTGLYQGQLQLANEVRNISLGIYTLEMKEGTNSSGESLFKPVLKAVYRQISPIEAPIVLDARFVPETGELSFTNPDTNISNDVIHTINSSIHGTRINGLVKTLTGILGSIELNFVQKHVEAPTEGDDLAISQKLREQYAQITGTYAGKIKKLGTPIPGVQSEWDVEIGVYALEMKSGTNSSGESIFKPILKAVFKQNFPIAPNIILDAQYLPESGQIIFINPNANSDNLNTIDAHINNKIIDGTAKKTSGLWGNIHLELVSRSINSPPSSDEDELNRKIREQYQEISGTYKGKITRAATDGQAQQEWQVELSLYILEVRAGTTPTGEPQFKPTLKALFKQISPVVPNAFLDVQYIAETGQLLMSNTQAGTDQINSIISQLTNNSIKGTAQKISGYWGQIELQFLTKDVGTPGVGDEEDYNRRLTQEYQNFVGNYTGTIRPNNGESAFDIEVKIFIIQEPVNNLTVARLKAYYKRTTDQWGATDLTMNVNCRLEVSPPAVDMAGERSFNGRPYFVVLNGRFENGQIVGQYHDQRGYEGPFRLTKQR